MASKNLQADDSLIDASFEQLIDQSTPLGSVLYRVIRLANRLDADASKVITSRSEASVVVWRILVLMQISKEKTLSDFVRLSGMDAGQLSRKANRMVKEGYLSTTENPNDQRSRRFELTQAGKDLFRALKPLMHERQKRLLSDISDEDLKTTMRVLSCIENNIE